jgi:hypothetical protein
MVKGNVGNTKEYVQCLAFAYFANHKYPNKKEDQEEHKLSFYNLFVTSSDRKEFNIEKLNLREYKSHLGNRFPYIRTTRDFKTKVNQKGKITADTTVQKVYDVALELYKSKVIGQNWENYEFLDQTDIFTQTVKDAALNKIKEVLGITFKLDMLASFDMFVVHKKKKQTILNEINTYILNASDSTILKNYSLNQHTYRTILNRHFKSTTNTRSLVAISLKLPGTVEQKKYINIIGTENVKKELSDYIDPYTKFLTLAISSKPNELKSLIENLIKIEYGQFRTGSNVLTWELPVTFRYKVAAQKVFGRDIEPLSDMDYKIVFLAQGYGAGWNGFVKVGKQGPPWTGGGAASTFEFFYEQYPEYSLVIQKLVQLRAKAFNYVLTGKENGRIDDSTFSTKLKTSYRAALREITTRKILVNSRTAKYDKIEEFFNLYDKETGNKDSITMYYVAVINLVRGKVKSSIKITDNYASFSMFVGQKKERKATTSETQERIKAHYAHAQLAWFTFIGGKSYQAYLKQRMFLTIYGVISKKGYKIFDYNKNISTVKSAITASIKKMPKAAFDSAPHLLLS